MHKTDFYFQIQIWFIQKIVDNISSLLTTLVEILFFEKRSFLTNVTASSPYTTTSLGHKMIAPGSKSSPE